MFDQKKNIKHIPYWIAPVGYIHYLSIYTRLNMLQ